MPTFLNPGGGFFNQTGGTPVRVQVANTTGVTVNLLGSDTSVYFSMAGTLAAYTVRMPSGPSLGQRIELRFGAAVTTLTLADAAGVTIPGAPTTVPLGSEAIIMRYVSPAIGWVAWSGATANVRAAAAEETKTKEARR